MIKEIHRVVSDCLSPLVAARLQPLDEGALLCKETKNIAPRIILRPPCEDEQDIGIQGKSN